MKFASRRTLAYVVVLVVVLALFAFLVLNYTRRVTGNSMLPTLEAGDLVFVVNVPTGSVQAGDIVVYNPPCSTYDFSVIHRVVGFQGGGFITKGDNNPSTDQASGIASSPVTPNCYEGKVVFVVPYLERISDLPYGTNYLIAALIVVIVILSEFYGRERNVGEPVGAAKVAPEGNLSLRLPI